MKYKVKSKEYLLTVQLKTSFGENIDERILDAFSRVYIRGFLKAKKLGKNKYEYTGPIGISLKERLQKTISKRDVLFIVEHIVFAMQKIQNAKLPVEHLVTDMNNIFFNENTKELQFLYVPVMNSKECNNVMELLSKVIYSVKPLQENDTEYLSKLHYYMMNIKEDYSLIEKFILKEDRTVVNTIKKHNIGQSGFMTNDQVHYHEHYDAKMDECDDDEKTSLLVEDEATSLLVEEEEDEATALLVEEEPDGDATGLLIENEVEVIPPHFARLERVLTGESINVNKAVFRLGKEKSYVDYFVNNNNAVSRSHADIIQRGQNFYIKDLNSKNFTYVNTQKIPVQVEVQIYDGDRIKLANEEFIFHE